MKITLILLVLVLTSCVDQKAKNEALSKVKSDLQVKNISSAKTSLTKVKEIAGENDSDYLQLKNQIETKAQEIAQKDEQERIAREVVQVKAKIDSAAKGLVKYWGETCTKENLNKLFSEKFRSQSDKNCLLSLYSEYDNHVPELVMMYGVNPVVGFFRGICKHFEGGKYQVACSENKIVSLQVKGRSNDFYTEVVKKYGEPKKTNKLKQGRTMDSNVALHFQNNDAVVFSAITNWYGGKDYYAKYFKPSFLSSLKDKFEIALKKQKNKEKEKAKKDSESVL